MKLLHKILMLVDAYLGESERFRRVAKLFRFSRLHLELEGQKQKRKEGNGSGHRVSVPVDDASGYVLFAPVFGFGDIARIFEGLLINAVHVQGGKTAVFGCGSALAACMHDSEKFLTSKSRGAGSIEKVRRRLKCIDCQTRLRRSGEAYGSDLIMLSEAAESLRLEDHPNFQSHAVNSALRKCLIGTPEGYPQAGEVMAAFEAECGDYYGKLRSLFAGRMPSAVVMVHGIYLEHGVLLDFFKDSGVPVYVYGFAYRYKTVSVVSGDTYHVAAHAIKEEQWNNPLSKADEQLLQEYLASKVSGGRDFITYHPNAVTNREGLLRDLGENFCGDVPTLMFCTNVLWDAALYYTSDAYSSMLDALEDIITEAQANNFQLIIRMHPAEAKGGFAQTRQPLEAELRKRWPVLPSNVFVIKPESDLSTYRLGDLCKAVLIYGSNVGLEFSCAGKPVINVGRPYSSGRGFSIDIQSRQELLKLLRSPLDIPEMTPEDIELAKRFAYWWSFKFMTDIESLSYDMETVTAWTPEQAGSSLYAPPCSNLEIIARAILQGRPISHKEFQIYD